MKAEREPVTPFYKEPMVLLVAGIPLLAVIWGFVMLNLALGSKDSLVSDSYYKDGVSFTENVEVDAKATALNIQAELTFNSSDAVLQLSGDFSGEAEPASLQLKLIHPTLQEQDLDVFLQRIGPGQYAGVNELVLPQRRHIWLQSPEQGWRVRTTDFIQANKAVILSAQ
ncbi:FixH family protein [Venatoribacter cucullus]|uniref:Uncharacterized protein n=1 Tax=Venatoribacter cucullus TaxID=2661630 RepID=A0A9E8FP76_9GAMM|nr:FixH family protein [Venatoribacter cucullus]QQD21663.1 hypothetical protein GJQ54_07730 [Oceanospirillaceae bacterium ASx5O]QQD24348.1 hypothetical protein GJQ55_07610 [Venatoribacter cucullus]UZK03473.1 hypothetical protein GAY96_05970 [Venatoribacter cucullus]